MSKRNQRSLSTDKPRAVVSAPEERPLSHRVTILSYLGIALLALLLRGAYLYQLQGSLLLSVLVADGREYDAWGQRIAAGDWLGTEVFYQAPLYPYLLGVIYRVVGHNVMAVRVLQAVLGSLACVLLAWTGRRFFSERVGLIAGLFLAVFPPAIYFDGLIQKPSLDLFLLTLFLALAAEFTARRTWPWLLAGAAVLGALALNRENARLLCPVVMVWLLADWRAAALGRRAAWAAIFAVGFALPLLPVGWRNYRVGGEFLLSTSQLGPNFYIGNHKDATGRYESLLPGRGDPMHERIDATLLAEQAAGKKLTPSEVSDYWLHRALADMRAQPVRWLRLMAWKTLLVFHRAEIVDAEGIDAYWEASSLLRGLSWPLSFGVLCPLAVFGAWATRRDAWRLALLYIVLATLAFSVALFFVFARYRFSLTPILVLFAAAGLAAIPEFVRAVQRGDWLRAWGPGLLLAGLAAVATNWPLPELRDPYVTYFGIGARLMDKGRLDEAIAAFDYMIQHNPGFGYAHYNKGRALMLQRNADAAQQEFELAIAADPQIGQAHFFLGQILRTRKSWAEAEQHLRTAVKLGPGDPLGYNELAQTFIDQNRPAEAAVELRAGLKAQPQSMMVANNLAWLLATCPDASVRDGAEAVRLAEATQRQVKQESVEQLDTLAAAYAEAGRFEDATATMGKAIALATQPDQQATLADLRAKLLLYEQKQPFRQPAAQ